jgi:hypothetical protein
VRLAATDLAGNFSRLVGALEVAPRGRPSAGSSPTPAPNSGGGTLAGRR